MAPGQGTEGDGKKPSGMLAFRGLLGESWAFNPPAHDRVLGWVGKESQQRGRSVASKRDLEWQRLSRCQGEEAERAVFEKPEVFPCERLAATQSRSISTLTGPRAAVRGRLSLSPTS